MKDMRLTPHFCLSEFTRSGTAQKYGIDNSPTPDIILRLRILCREVLEPLREYAGRPVIISSGYRSPQLNSHPEVRGRSTSQHLTGEAVDIHIPDESTGRRWFLWMMDNLHFDQLIWEKATPQSTRHWIHVSFNCYGHQRQQVKDNLVKFK